MRSSWRVLLRAVAVVTVLVAAACTQDAGDADSTPAAEGTGHLMAGYLRTPADEGRFSGDPVPVQAELLVLGNGCVAVVVDAVERLPIWPDGTSVVQDPDDLDRYVVTLLGGTVLVATTSGGDEFTADGVIDDPGHVVDPTEPQSVVGMMLEFCGLDAAPILFADVGTFSASP